MSIAAAPPRRVVLTGPESTGKTWLAERLARRFGTAWSPEFSRAYAEARAAPLGFADHGPIARGQAAAEDDAVARATALGARVVFHDTDLLSTALYCDHYFGRAPEWIVETARARRPELYLLLDVDVPWEADGVRDRGDRREEMRALFERWLTSLDAPWVLVSGGWEEREERAAGEVRRLLDLAGAPATGA